MADLAALLDARLEADIRAGGLPPGARLPTHRALAAEHDIAVNTATCAMRLLTDLKSPTVPTCLQITSERGRMAWQKASGYNWRALFEAAISPFKRIITDGLRSRTNRRRATKVATAAGALNRMLELGRPNYVRLP